MRFLRWIFLWCVILMNFAPASDILLPSNFVTFVIHSCLFPSNKWECLDVVVVLLSSQLERKRMFTRGWSEDQIKSTLKNNPTCMKAPEKKILLWFINCYSLKEKIIPKWPVIRILDPECLFKEKISSAMVDE